MRAVTLGISAAAGVAALAVGSPAFAGTDAGQLAASATRPGPVIRTVDASDQATARTVPADGTPERAAEGRNQAAAGGDTSGDALPSDAPSGAESAPDAGIPTERRPAPPAGDQTGGEASGEDTAQQGQVRRVPKGGARTGEVPATSPEGTSAVVVGAAAAGGIVLLGGLGVYLRRRSVAQA
jgi:hypothetical protein